MSADTRLSGYEATEASLGPWERDADICWETTPRLGRGSQPADLIPAGVWPKDGAA